MLSQTAPVSDTSTTLSQENLETRCQSSSNECTKAPKSDDEHEVQCTQPKRSTFDKGSLLLAANIMQITEWEESVQPSSPQSTPSTPDSPSPSSGSGMNFLATAGIGDTYPKQPSSSVQPCASRFSSPVRQESCESLCKFSDILGGELQNQLTDETEKHILDVLHKGAWVDACDAIRNIMEAIMSIAIVSRCVSGCTDKVKRFDHEKAEKQLRSFVGEFNEGQKYALDLLFALEFLDKQVLDLAEQSLYLKILHDSHISREDLNEQLETILQRVNQIQPNEKHPSKIYKDAVLHFRTSYSTLTTPAGEKDGHYGKDNFELLKDVSQKLKLGTVHKIVMDLHIEMKKLADGKLNGFMFFPSREEAKLKKLHDRPLIREGHQHAEDIVDGIEGFGATPDEDLCDNMDKFFDKLDSLASLYFSSYVPEFDEVAGKTKDPKEGYIECDISLVTKLVSMDDEVKKQFRAVYVHKKVKGIFQDYKSLLKENGKLQRKVERLEETNVGLQKYISELREKLDSFRRGSTIAENNNNVVQCDRSRSRVTTV